jgi:hypothetical protein
MAGEAAVTYLFGRTAANLLRASRAGRKTADVIALSPSPPHFSWPMLLIGTVLIASLAACGVKNDLVRPNGKPTAENERDPSRPPNQTGR